MSHLLDHRRSNGAGKTTFALEYLPKVADCTHFINADLIAASAAHQIDLIMRAWL